MEWTAAYGVIRSTGMTVTLAHVSEPPLTKG